MNEFYGIDKNSSTKDKNTVLKKLNKLENMMCGFLGIVKIKPDEDAKADILNFVQENVTPHVTLEDVGQYAEVLETLARNAGKSKLWEKENMPSLIALVAWSFEYDTDLDQWIVDYCGRNGSYIKDQTENFRHMREDLEKFIKAKAA